MKKLIALPFIFTLFLTGCSNDVNKNENETVNESSTVSEVQNSKVTKEVETKKEKPTITELNTIGEMRKDDEVPYTLEVTEVLDVTEEAKNKSINDTNFLDYYSSGQAKQAVRITIKMHNQSGETFGVPYLDETKVIDKDGITNVGGWKEHNGTESQFGMFQLTGENGEPDPKLYDISDGETKLATSTVLLATPSDTISFEYVSQVYNDSIKFELPITK